MEALCGTVLVTWSHELSREVLLFVLIGIGATVVDFGIFNWLAGPTLRWNRVWASVVSSSFGMVFKFLANWKVVFHAQEIDWVVTLAGFIAVNAFSSYGIQTVVILVCARLRIPSVALSDRMALRLSCPSEAFARNAVKALAIGCGMVWNFAWCKWVVFR